MVHRSYFRLFPTRDTWIRRIIQPDIDPLLVGINPPVAFVNFFQGFELALDGDLDKEVVAAIDGPAPADCCAANGAQGQLRLGETLSSAEVAHVHRDDLFSVWEPIQNLDHIQS